MARPPSQAKLFAELQDRYGRAIAEAFLKAFGDLRSAAKLQLIITEIEAGDFEGALEVLDIDPAAFNPVRDAIDQAYNEAGTVAAQGLPKRDARGAAMTIRFDGRNLRAEAWLRENSSTLVTRIVDDSRTAVRQTLVAGMEAGRNPRSVALDIVGRVNRVSGKREGGTLGLTAQQETFVRNARAELESGDPAKMRNYLERNRRSKTFDRSVAKAIREEKPLPPETVGKAIVAYERRLLQLRGEVVGAHEAFAALAGAKHETYVQSVEAGRISADVITKRWRHFLNKDPRRQHIAMSGVAVRFDAPFVLPDGVVMQYPHDPAAPVRHTAGCHCQADYKVDFLAGLG